MEGPMCDSWYCGPLSSTTLSHQSAMKPDQTLDLVGLRRQNTVEFGSTVIVWSRRIPASLPAPSLQCLLDQFEFPSRKRDTQEVLVAFLVEGSQAC